MRTRLRTLTVGAIVLLSAFAFAGLARAGDADGDGLDDAWEMAYFSTLAWGAEDDNDRDGYSNLEEYNGGSDPTDPMDWPWPPPGKW